MGLLMRSARGDTSSNLSVGMGSEPFSAIVARRWPRCLLFSPVLLGHCVQNGLQKSRNT
jgi:hypothetical protein